MTARNAFVFAVSMILARSAAFAQAPEVSPFPPDAEIRKILAERIGSENLGIAMVVGVIDSKGRRVVSYGSPLAPFPKDIAAVVTSDSDLVKWERQEYQKVAPDPKQWPTLVAKVKKMGLDFKGFTREELHAIKVPVLITLGDHDGVRPEHAVEMFRLIPNAQLAVFPGADHFLLFQSPEKLLPMIAAFLDAHVPEPKKPEGK